MSDNVEYPRYGKLQVIEPVTDYWRLKCLQCGSGHVVASTSALESGLLKMCSDCTELANLTPAQRALAAFKKKLDLSPEPAVLDAVMPTALPLAA
jgi:hypothetical protein